MASANSSRNVLIVLAILAILLVAWVVSPFATALLLAAVLAGALHPGMERLTRALRGRRSLAAGLLTFAVLMAVVVPIAAFAATLLKQVADGYAWLRETLASQGVSALIAYLPAALRPHAERFVHELPQT